jgi:hypothetical protein
MMIESFPPLIMTVLFEITISSPPPLTLSVLWDRKAKPLEFNEPLSLRDNVPLVSRVN